MILSLLVVSLLVLILNIPFGYWRANVSKFSFQWVLAIHLPVPFIVALRLLFSISFDWYTFIFLMAAFFLGQSLGAYIYKNFKSFCLSSSSCLVMDVIRCVKH